MESYEEENDPVESEIDRKQPPIDYTKNKRYN